ncbi:CBS domain-containing protein [Cystobacter ferrugineus]|nr:CBS domain-containing protein [Cystobacter ferrugineus]
MKIHEVMTPDAVSAHPEMTLMAAAEMMRLLNVDTLPVVEDERVVGLVTDRGIVVRGLALGFDPRTTPIVRVMARHVPGCEPHEDAREVAERMRQLRVRRLIVMDAQERLLGSVSLGELQQGPRTAPPEDEEIFVHPRP